MSGRKLSSTHHHFHTHQTTVCKDVEIRGIGLHSGKDARITIKAALPNTGILFIRKDLATPVAIPALFEYVTQTRLATTLGREDVEVATVEHLLCAFQLVGIDNAVVEVEGPEVPIMDGSADQFCEALLNSGIYRQNAPKKVAHIKKRIEVRKGDKVAAIAPGPELTVQAKIEWDHPVIGSQNFSYTVGQSNPSEISKARTFGFLKDVETLKKAGLARGGSLDNAVVLDDEKILNPKGLRYQDEFVRHKILDAIGDFALAPHAFVGSVTLVKAGHEMHAELINAVFSNPNNFEIRTLHEAELEETAAL